MRFSDELEAPCKVPGSFSSFRSLCSFCALCVTAALIQIPAMGATGPSAPRADVPPLRVAVSSSWGMPFAKFQGDQVVGGLVPDLSKALAVSLEMPLRFVILPGKRFEAASMDGQFDLRCYLEPAWVEAPEAYEWSGALFSFNDVVVGQRDSPSPRALKDLASGARVSVVEGYVYPGVDAQFKSGALKRDVSPDQVKVLAKVARGHTPYGISNVLALSWFVRHNLDANLSNWQLAVGHVDFQCVVPHASSLDASKTFKALHQLKQSGALDEILGNYR
ncbi:MAG: transporter substrate-binding domain-containing protein [Burkholderiaceae bacterium]|nr:transporter substrate-binding domain-containing protein [Burkholderiaceae bacterium]